MEAIRTRQVRTPSMPAYTAVFAGSILTSRMSCAVGQMKTKALKRFSQSFLMQHLLELRKGYMTRLSP